jgi:2-iminobutanoate/2-iminopropanoate deaminase
MKKIAWLPVLLISLSSFSQSKTPLVQQINPPAVAVPKGYSQASILDLGSCKMVIISGQVALDRQGNLVGKDDTGKQAEQVFQNIKSIVEAAGGTMNHLVKLGYFITDVKQIQTIRNIRDKYINTQSPPASTLVEASKLFREDILLEIEATAVIPNK